MKSKCSKENRKRKLKEYEIDMGERGIYNKRNKLNNLTGKEWTKFTKSWFIFDAIPSDIKEEEEISKRGGLNSGDHPATYSPTMMAYFISFFTKKGQVVLDPFCGIGSTLVGCDRTEREGIGIELNKKYAKIAKLRTKQKVIVGDSLKIKDIWEKNNLPKVNFCISSPPYWNILQRSTGVFEKVRTKNSLDVKYSEDDVDIGNISDYDVFLDKVCKIYDDIYDIMEEGAYMVIIVKNVKKKGKMYTLAWDIAKRLTKRFELKDEKIWCQDKIGLSPFGYPFAWTSNIVHHYCIILRKDKK
jgi:DNA modification methylase